MFWRKRRHLSKIAASALVNFVYGNTPPVGNYTDEMLFKTLDKTIPLERQDFCELRLFATHNPLGTQLWVEHKYGRWDGEENRVVWDQEIADSFWIFDEARARYAERRSALAQQGFIYSDMDEPLSRQRIISKVKLIFITFKLCTLLILAAIIHGDTAASEPDFTSGTLILVGVTEDALTVAADSASVSPAEGRRLGSKKIYPISKFAACTVSNAVAITMHHGQEVSDYVDFDALVTVWAAHNRNATVQQANDALSDSINQSLKAFYTRNVKFLPSSQLTVSLTCIGYDEQKVPQVYTNDIHESSVNKGLDPTISRGSFRPPPGLFVPFGETEVCQDLLNGAALILNQYRMTSAVQKYRSFFKEKKLGSLSTVDMLALSKACLSATESAVGLKFDPGAYVVAAPNHYAVISKTTGFREINLAATHQP